MVQMHVLPPAGTPRGRNDGREDKMKQLLSTLWQDESGQDLAEYALLLALIAIALITAITLFRGAIGDRFNNATDTLNSA
jgi:Flp pilus assembly pilin Flp